MAVMVGFLSVVLFAVAAFSVDLGNAWARKREVQKQVDVAALSAAHVLPMTTANADDIALEVARTLADAGNDVIGQSVPTNLSALAGDLRDHDPANGEIYFQNDAGAACTNNCNRMRVLAPGADVDFAIAGILGADGTTVQREAVVQVKEAVVKTVPFYAFEGCDFGGQTLVQPTNGHAADIVRLSHGTETNAAVLSNLATTPFTSPATVPVGVAAPNDVVTITGTGLGAVTEVGFFESGTAGPGPEPVTVPIADPSVVSRDATSIRLHLPADVIAVETFWYVRVKIGASWSRATHTQGGDTILDALPLEVGSPTLTCGQGSSAGNFGTLKVPHPDGPSGNTQNIAYNIAVGLKVPLGIYPADASGGRPPLCTTSGQAPYRKQWMTPGTNCLDTQTGLGLAEAQMGFFDGVAGEPGRLRDTTSGGCGATPATTSTLYTEAHAPVTKPWAINNDTLSCFLTDTGTNLGTIASEAYAGGPALSPAIYESPRFAMVPVLAQQPGNGGSALYTIVDMRPAFITDQPMSATKTSPVTQHNGITVKSNGQHDLASLQMVFFNKAALPPPPAGTEVTDYTGSGLKVARLVG